LQKYKNNTDENVPAGFFSLSVSGWHSEAASAFPAGKFRKIKKNIFSERERF